MNVKQKNKEQKCKSKRKECVTLRYYRPHPHAHEAAHLRLTSWTSTGDHTVKPWETWTICIALRRPADWWFTLEMNISENHSSSKHRDLSLSSISLFLQKVLSWLFALTRTGGSCFWMEKEWTQDWLGHVSALWLFPHAVWSWSMFLLGFSGYARTSHGNPCREHALHAYMLYMLYMLTVNVPVYGHDCTVLTH